MEIWRAYEVNTDGRDVAFCVGVVCESKQQAGFSYSRISDQEELEEVIVSMRDGQPCIETTLDLGFG